MSTSEAPNGSAERPGCARLTSEGPADQLTGLRSNINLMGYAFCEGGGSADAPGRGGAPRRAIANGASVRSVVAGGGNPQCDTTKAAQGRSPGTFA
jgi:hypothetical protein